MENLKNANAVLNWAPNYNIQHVTPPGSKQGTKVSKHKSYDDSQEHSELQFKKNTPKLYNSQELIANSSGITNAKFKNGEKGVPTSYLANGNHYLVGKQNFNHNHLYGGPKVQASVALGAIKYP